LVIIYFTLAPTSFSQSEQNKSLDTQRQKEIIDSVVSCYDQNYVFQDVARQMSDYLYKRYENGDYKEITSPEAFVDSLTADMRSISKDDHIRIYYRPDEFFKSDESEEMIDGVWETGLAQDKYFNFDFVKVERLLGNIGYLRFNQFRDADQAGATAIAALNFLAYCDALIIDLRTNGGGEPSMIQLISSYFFDEPKHLNSFYIRKTDSVQEFWTHSDVKGPRMSDIDLYILVSKHTFSAAEEFAYNLKHMGRATLIGQVTGGGAHHSQFHDIEHLNIQLKVPYAEAVNPITGSNWE
jgi:C-terminal processing protease CtpA/Prc